MSHPWLAGPAPVCVLNPCTPGLAGCVGSCSEDVCGARSCDETLSNTGGWVDCDGRRVTDWYCASMCADTLGPFSCHQDTTGRVECWTETPL